MQLSPSYQNVVDSLLNESLPEYKNQNFFPNLIQINESSNPSLKQATNSYRNQIRGPLIRFVQDLRVAKAQFYKDRKELIEKQNLTDKIKDVINTLPRNDELKEQVERKQQEVVKIKIQTENLKEEQLQPQEDKQKEIQLKNKVNEKVKEFSNKLAESLKSQRLDFQDQAKTNTQAQKVLHQNLKKRSEATRRKLQPYLEYEQRAVEQQNKVLKENQKQLQKLQEQFDDQWFKEQEELMHQQFKTKKKNEIEDLIEDQKEHCESQRKYNERLKNDDKILNNKQE